jgi:hypothetical protein
VRSRQYAAAIASCALAAAIVLYAASRTWLVEVVARPDPLPAIGTARSGGWLVPLLPALALVGLAGAGGLLATRGRARTAVGALVTVVGLGIPVSVSGVLTRSGVAVGWVVLSMLAGLVVAGVGVLAIRRGRSWPTMGSRYERPGQAVTSRDDPVPAFAAAHGNELGKEHAEAHGKAHGKVHGEARGKALGREPGQSPDNPGTGVDLGTAGLWDALDRGEDPTKE